MFRRRRRLADSAASAIRLAAVDPATGANLRQRRFAAERVSQGIVQRLAGALAFTQLLEEASQQLPRFQSWTNRNTRFEVTARLAIQLGTYRQSRAAQQQ